MPNYREIDRDPRWHHWLLGTDALSGEVRQRLLNTAIQSGDAGRVIAFFRGYQREAGAGGSQPTSARGQRSSGKPVYTRETIGQLYDARRRGEYAGREQEWQRQEADIFAAQREGRVQGVPYLTK